MEIYLVRHGIAEDSMDAYAKGRTDSQRRLTAEGLEKTRKVAAAFRQRVERLDLILHSPYLRAKETAKLFAVEYGGVELREETSLRLEEDPENAAKLIWGLQGLDRVLMVGHNPHLSLLASYLLAGNFTVAVTFKKAAIAGFACDGPANSRLLFLVPPRILLGPS